MEYMEYEQYIIKKNEEKSKSLQPFFFYVTFYWDFQDKIHEW